MPAVAMESKAGREHYTAVIVPRRDAGARAGAPAREGLVVFAVSAPWAGVERCAKRWGTGTWHREPERPRIRTASTSPAGRAPCLAYSLIMPSAWAVAMAMAGMASRRAAKWARVTHSEFCDVAEGMADRGTPLPEPPPGPP